MFLWYFCQHSLPHLIKGLKIKRIFHLSRINAQPYFKTELIFLFPFLWRQFALQPFPPFTKWPLQIFSSFSSFVIFRKFPKDNFVSPHLPNQTYPDEIYFTVAEFKIGLVRVGVEECNLGKKNGSTKKHIYATNKPENQNKDALKEKNSKTYLW